jgi:hypothetical protein
MEVIGVPPLTLKLQNANLVRHRKKGSKNINLSEKTGKRHSRVVLVSDGLDNNWKKSLIAKGFRFLRV